LIELKLLVSTKANRLPAGERKISTIDSVYWCSLH
jgi:hypothetical protein